MKIDKLFDLLPFLKQKKQISENIIQRAEIKAKEIILSAKEEALKIEKAADQEAKKLTQEGLNLERRLEYKEKEMETIKKRLEGEKRRVEQEKKQLLAKREEILTKLEKIAKLSQTEAKDLILHSWEEKLKSEIAKRIKVTEEEIKNKADEKAKEILVDAMRYGAVDFTAEYTLSSISLPSEEFKGRIIGKEGRNIRTFELATGVDVELDEEGVIKFSSFDAVRREIARVSMERLIRDGRIQPQRIEEIVEKTKKEIEKIIIKAGEELCHKVGIYNLPFEIIKLLGKFKYRYSYGQNMILHTLEEVKIGAALAHELKADINTIRLGCLLHDIGKVITEKEGSHVQLGVGLLKKYKFSQKVIDCVASHHEDVPFSSVEAIIVYIADAVSGSRPGARHEDFQEYLKRIKTIEEVAKSKKGVVEAYALQAGRELRVVVKPEEISDDESTVLAEKIREEIEAKFPSFPGQVKITIIREFRVYSTSHT
jgi:ribonuclease Y